eukprot:9483991-Pyramimonas_sp.AAC.1
MVPYKSELSVRASHSMLECEFPPLSAYSHCRWVTSVPIQSLYGPRILHTPTSYPWVLRISGVHTYRLFNSRMLIHKRTPLSANSSLQGARSWVRPGYQTRLDKHGARPLGILHLTVVSYQRIESERLQTPHPIHHRATFRGC